MANYKMISLGNGGTNILNGMRKHLPQEVVTASLCSDNGKIDESDIAPLFSEDLSEVVLITCLGGRCSEETCRSAEKTLEDIRNETDILIVLKNDWLNEKYGNLPINVAMREMDMMVWKLINNYVTID